MVSTIFMRLVSGIVLILRRFSMFSFQFLTPPHVLNNKDGRCNLLFSERTFCNLSFRGIPRVVL